MLEANRHLLRSAFPVLAGLYPYGVAADPSGRFRRLNFYCSQSPIGLPNQRPRRCLARIPGCSRTPLGFFSGRQRRLPHRHGSPPTSTVRDGRDRFHPWQGLDGLVWLHLGKASSTPASEITQLLWQPFCCQLSSSFSLSLGREPQSMNRGMKLESGRIDVR